jgi:putative endonuclease
MNGARQNVQGLGRTGEKLAARFLEKKGFKILEHNFRARQGEIDLIAEDGEFLVFVEVKSSYRTDAESPVFRVDTRKQARLAKAAEVYLVKHEIDDERSVRFDVVTVQFVKGKPHIEHIEDAFWTKSRF